MIQGPFFLQVETRLRDQMADLQKQLAEVTALLRSSKQSNSSGGVKEHGGYFSDGENSLPHEWSSGPRVGGQYREPVGIKLSPPSRQKSQ
jgi:hypothetical protein